MPVEIKGFPIQHYFEIVYTGTVTGADQSVALQKGMPFVKHGMPLILTNTIEIEGVPPVDEVFQQLIHPLEQLALPAEMKEAILLPRDPRWAEHVLFYEAACRNRGLQVQSFTDREKAMAWLLDNSGIC